MRTGLWEIRITDRYTMDFLLLATSLSNAKSLLPCAVLAKLAYVKIINPVHNPLAWRSDQGLLRPKSVRLLRQGVASTLESRPVRPIRGQQPVGYRIQYRGPQITHSCDVWTTRDQRGTYHGDIEVSPQIAMLMVRQRRSNEDRPESLSSIGCE